MLPKILIINDDGVHSPGLSVLKSELDKLAETFVITPKRERSGIGKAISSRRIEIEEIPDFGGFVYAITGTPADAYLLAVYKILKQPPDLVVAGINLGPNLGVDDFFTSGTLGAAIEAAIHGTPAIAVSYCVERFFEGQDKASLVTEENLKLCAVIARKTVEYILDKGMPPDVDIISINVPESVKLLDFEATCLSYEGYQDLYVERDGGYVIERWVLADYPDDVKGTDLYAVKKRKKVSVTPIKLRFVHNTEGLKELLNHLSQS